MSRMWNKMSWVRWSTDEARVKSNTYSCKPGSLCNLGRWPRGERYPLRPAENGTRGSQWKATPTGGDERNRVRWAKIKRRYNRSAWSWTGWGCDLMVSSQTQVNTSTWVHVRRGRASENYGKTKKKSQSSQINMSQLCKPLAYRELLPCWFSSHLSPTPQVQHR